MSGLSERDVERLVREVCPCDGSDHNPATRMECDWAFRLVSHVGESSVLAEHDAAIRAEAWDEGQADTLYAREAEKPLPTNPYRTLLDGGD